MEKKNYTPLIIFCIFAWTLVGVLCIILFNSFKSIPVEEPFIEKGTAWEVIDTTSKILPPSIDYREMVLDQAKRQQDLLNQSISLCKNEYAEKIAKAVMREHSRQGIPVYVAYSLLGTESDKTRTNNITVDNSGNFNPRAHSKANCRGLTQICQDTLNDFNTFNKFGHHYTWEDMFDIDKSIEVGVWHYMRYIPYVGEDWIELYIIYNTGYRNYSKVNSFWIYNDNTEKWEKHNNDWYYRNSKYPPKNVNLCFSDLANFAPTKRFTIYINMYSEIFEYL